MKGEPKPDLKTEIVAGITTFFTMGYIIVVNPALLSSDGTGIPFSGALTATVLLSFLMTLAMGLYARLPFAVAPGMGINAFFTFSVVIGQHIPWPTAFGMIFWAGVLFVLVSVTPLREAIARAIPHDLRAATAAGIGVFLSFIGLKNAGFIQADPATFVTAGTLGPKSWLTLAGLAVTIALFRKKNPFAFLAGILVITIGSLAFGWAKIPEHLFSPPDFQSVFLKLDFAGSLKLTLLPTILSILFTDLFDSISTFIGVSHATGMLDENGEPLRLREGLIVDAFATLFAGLFGTPSGTAYLESAAGIEVGGTTGRTAVVTAFCFLPFLFLGPLAGMVPLYATAPVLVVIGALMFASVKEMKLDKIEDAIPGFVTLILIPLTFSITQGILWGFIAHVSLYLMAGRRREVHPLLFGLAALAVVLLLVEHGHW